MTYLVFLLFSLLTQKPVTTLTCPSEYKNATINPAYYKATSDVVKNLVLPECDVDSLREFKDFKLSWAKDINPPRSLTYTFKIRIACTGEIVDVRTVDILQQYSNDEGEIVSRKLTESISNSMLESCVKIGIVNLNKITPLTIDGKSVNTEFPLVVSFTNL
jgi:hypothetical protein